MLIVDLPAECLAEHRIYDFEVLEFSPQVAMVVLLPPRDQVCSVATTPTSSEDEPAKSDAILSKRNDLIGIPMKPFEISHLLTYQRDFILNYARTQVFLELEVTAAQQAEREVGIVLLYSSTSDLLG